MFSKTEELTGEVSVHGFFDFGKDAFATLDFELDGNFAENTEVIIGEVARDGKIIHEPGFTTFIQHIFKLKNGHHRYHFQIPTYIPAYDGFPYCTAPEEANGEVAPFRYVEINRYYGKVTLHRTVWYCDWNEDASTFDSSDPRLNNVWKFCKYSIQATSLFSCYVDGERERMPYEADAYIAQLGHFCSDVNYRIARNTIQHFFDQGCFTWPTEWLLLTPLLVRDYLFYSGDTKTVQSWLPLLEEKLLSKFMTPEGLLAPACFLSSSNRAILDENHRFVQQQIRDIVDWPETERDHYELEEINFVPNAYLYMALRTMAELTGDTVFEQRAANLKSAIRKYFLKNGLYADSIHSNHTGIHSAMFALTFGLADGEEIAAHKAIIAGKKMACSVYGSQFLLDACFQYGLANHALALLTSQDERSWFNMMREGATISMESWGCKWKDNQDWNHPWGASPANIITRRLCGIRPVAPGFSRFTVDPQPGDLEFFQCIQPTIHGPVSLHYVRGRGIDMTVPEGTQAVYQKRLYAAGKYHLA